MPSTAELLDLASVRIDPAVAQRVPAVVALRRQALLFGEDDEHAFAALADADDPATIEALERSAGKPVRAFPTDPARLRETLEEVYGRVATAAADDAVRSLDELMQAAVIQRASDLHFEPVSDGLRVRMRVDGELEIARKVPPAAVPALTNRIKVLAEMDIAERRAPQDGSFRWRYGRPGAERSVDVRVACMPVRFGERLTLRLLALEAERIGLERLGLASADLELLRAAIEMPHGLLLLSGPTGSGKSTTLYSLLRTLDLASTSVLTIEDPIEYEIEGASQVETDGDDRINFARALRGLLRHDPDVLVIGEIRDGETADVAIKAALTGHQVYSTLHTSSAIGAVTRLVDMGLAPYLVASTLRLCVAQRLVRRLCARCRVEVPLAAHEALALGAPELEGSPAFAPRGCAFCKRAGFAGRMGVFELIPIGDALRSAIARGAAEGELLELAREAGARSLRADALEKVRLGLTSVREALRAVESGA